MTADHPTRSPDSPDHPDHPLLHCHRCGRCVCPLHEAIADDTWTDARRLCASCFDGTTPRSSDSVRTPDTDSPGAPNLETTGATNPSTVRLQDSVRTPDLDAERLRIEFESRFDDQWPEWMDAAWHESVAALHPASPPQEGEK
jgi:hypothetical protein